MPTPTPAPAPPRVVIGIMSWTGGAPRVQLEWALWARQSRFPVVVVTDSSEGLEGIDPSRIWVPDCGFVKNADQNMGKLCCKCAAARAERRDCGARLMCVFVVFPSRAPRSHYFLTHGPVAFPGTDWFLRVTDDSLVIDDGLTELLDRLGSAEGPVTVGHRYAISLRFDVVPAFPRHGAFGRTGDRIDEYATGGAWMASRGAVTDPRFAGAYRAECDATTIDDWAFGMVTKTLRWPRLRPDLAVWSYAPTAVVAPGKHCYPWFLCAARLAGMDPVAHVPDAEKLEIHVTVRPAVFHMNSQMKGLEPSATVLALLDPRGPLKLVVDTRGPPDVALDTYYADMFRREAALCKSAAAAVNAGRPAGAPRVDFDCDFIGSYTGWCGRDLPCCASGAPC